MRYPYLIAEAGSCHEGDLSRAISLTYLAKHCDADAIKWQYWSSASHMRARRRMEDTPLAYEQGSIDVRWFETLQRTAHDIGLDFMCTAYLPEDVAEVAKWVDHFKVSSFEARDEELIQAHAPYVTWESDKLLFVSDGKMKYVDQYPPSLKDGSALDHHSRIFHCVSEYPCPVEKADLKSIPPDGGFSDHTRTVMTGALAVAAGAQYVEVHFRLGDTKETCPDYCVALSPQELAEYVEGCRLTAVMLG